MSFLKLVSNHTFPKAYEQVPLSFIHLTKLKSSYIDHLKYEPDLSTHARDKGVKIAVDLRTPCSMPIVKGNVGFSALSLLFPLPKASSVSARQRPRRRRARLVAEALARQQRLLAKKKYLASSGRGRMITHSTYILRHLAAVV